MRRICPSCRTTYDENLGTCPLDGLPLLELSRTFAQLHPEGKSSDAPSLNQADDAPEQTPEVDYHDDNETVAVSPGMMVGEYMIERIIAEGGMGAIYAGIHPVISKRVAIKVINKKYAANPKAVARFVLEARSVNQIGHHNIVDIFSIGELEDQRNYMVMELLDGLSLSHILLRAKRLKPGEVLPVYEQLCDALDAAHAKGFIHRDMKPDNVLVLRRPPRPFIKVLDFGLAKLRGAAVSQNTEVGTVLGTPEYMAPEQCRGSSVDARTDIYALGVMAYELLTGVKPFTDPSPIRILTMHQRQAPVPPSQLSSISTRLEQVILRAMAKKPDERYPSVRELLTDLRRAIPEPLPWPEKLVLSVEQPGPGQQKNDLSPGGARRHFGSTMAPVSISGEASPISEEIEDEDYSETLVSAATHDQSPLEEALTAESPAGAMEALAATTRHSDTQAPQRQKPPTAAESHVPEPALVTPAADEDSDMAESTLVDDREAPAVLVDRPLKEGRSGDIDNPPQSARPELDPTGPLVRGNTGEEVALPPVLSAKPADNAVAANRTSPLAETGQVRPDATARRSPSESTVSGEPGRSRGGGPTFRSGSARKIPERKSSLSPDLLVALVLGLLLAVATVLLLKVFL